MKGHETFEYDVAISTRGARDEPQAAKTATLLAKMLRHHGLKVFMYDEIEEQDASSGQPLLPRLKKIYLSCARQILIVGSKSYAARGVTRDEFGWIQERLNSGDDGFLAVVSTTDDTQLPQDLQKLAYFNEKEDLQKVIALILRRAGRRGWHRLAGVLLLMAALLHLFLRCWQPPRLLWPMLVAGATCGIAVAGILLFVVAPRRWRWPITSKRVSRPGLLRRMAYSVAVEIAWWALVVLGTSTAHVGIARFRDQIDYHVRAWMAAEPSGHAPAVDFFKRLPLRTALSVWVPLMTRSQDLRPLDRGRILQMLHRLNVDVAGQLRSLVGKRIHGLELNTIVQIAGEADVRGANLDEIVLSGLAISGKGSLWANTTAERADLHGCFLQNVDMAFCDLRSSDLAKASFIGVNGPLFLSHAELQAATFFGSDLSGSTFLFADLGGARFKQCQLVRADFSNAQLTGAFFEDCDLSGVRFDNGVRQMGVWGRLTGVTFRRCRFSGANLQELNFGPAKVLLQWRTYSPIYNGDPTNLLANAVFGAPKRFGASLWVEVPGAQFIECSFEGGDWHRINLTSRSTAQLTNLWHLDLAEFTTKELIEQLRFVDHSMLALRLKSFSNAIVSEPIPAVTANQVVWNGSSVDGATRERLQSEGVLLPTANEDPRLGSVSNIWELLDGRFRQSVGAKENRRNP